MNIFATKDVKANVFNGIFAAPTIHTVKRDAAEMVNDPNDRTPISKYPDDFQIHKLGEIDLSTGEITPLKNSELQFTFSELKVVKNDKSA